MAPNLRLVYFTDENLLGLGKLLCRAGRTDVVHPGHEHLPEVPLGMRDVDWMPAVAARELVVLTRDRRIRTRPAELELYRRLGIRSVWLGGKRDLAPGDQLELFLSQESRLQRQIIKLGRGPWALTMTGRGVRPLSVGNR